MRGLRETRNSEGEGRAERKRNAASSDSQTGLISIRGSHSWGEERGEKTHCTPHANARDDLCSAVDSSARPAAGTSVFAEQERRGRRARAKESAHASSAPTHREQLHDFIFLKA